MLGVKHGLGIGTKRGVYSGPTPIHVYTSRRRHKDDIHYTRNHNNILKKCSFSYKSCARNRSKLPIYGGAWPINSLPHPIQLTLSIDLSAQLRASASYPRLSSTPVGLMYASRSQESGSAREQLACLNSRSHATRSDAQLIDSPAMYASRSQESGSARESS